MYVSICVVCLLCVCVIVCGLCVGVCIYMCVSACVCMWLLVYVCVCVFVCVYTGTCAMWVERSSPSTCLKQRFLWLFTLSVRLAGPMRFRRRPASVFHLAVGYRSILTNVGSEDPDPGSHASRQVLYPLTCFSSRIQLYFKWYMRP